MGSDDITLGELGRLVGALKADFVERTNSLERRFDERATGLSSQIQALQFVHRDTYEAEKDSQNRRLADLEEARRWLVRALATAIVFPLVVAAVAAFLVTR